MPGGYIPVISRLEVPIQSHKEGFLNLDTIFNIQQMISIMLIYAAYDFKEMFLYFQTV